MKWQGAIVLAAIVGLGCAALPAAAQNLLKNPGFELPVTADGPPFDDNWEAFSGGAAATAANSAAMPRTGAGHLDMTINNVDNSFAGVFQDVTGLAPGQPVTFSGWHKTTAAPIGLVGEVRIEWRNPAGTAEVSRTENFLQNPSTDYTQFSVTANVPAGAGIARVVYAIQTFGGTSNTGTIYLDDASVVIPEPGGVTLLGVGGWALLTAVRRRKSSWSPPRIEPTDVI